MKASLRHATLVLSLFLALIPAPARAHPGTGIIVDRDGRIFFTNLKEIWRLDPDGRLSIAVPNKHSHELYLDEHQNLWGEHLTYEPSRRLWWSSVWKLAPDGTFAEVLPPTQGFPKVFSPAMDRQGNHYFTEGGGRGDNFLRIVRKTPEGRIEVVAGGDRGHADGKGAAALFGSIYAMTVGPDGFLYLTDGVSVRKVSPDGAVTTLARGGKVHKASLFDRTIGNPPRPLMGLVVDESGTVFAANYGNRKVVKINPNGQVETVAKSQPPWKPTGVALAGRDLLLLENESRLGPWRGCVRVRRVSPNGVARTLAVIPAYR